MVSYGVIRFYTKGWVSLWFSFGHSETFYGQLGFELVSWVSFVRWEKYQFMINLVFSAPVFYFFRTTLFLRKQPFLPFLSVQLDFWENLFEICAALFFFHPSRLICILVRLSFLLVAICFKLISICGAEFCSLLCLRKEFLLVEPFSFP